MSVFDLAPFGYGRGLNFVAAKNAAMSAAAEQLTVVCLGHGLLRAKGVWRLKLVVGLGNPGAEYALTRHNAGFRAVELAAANLEITLQRRFLRALVGQGFYRGEKIILACPQTFMNASGESVVRLMNWYKLELSGLTVIYDELDLPPGRLRIRKGGGTGGHRGLLSLIQILGSDAFTRVRIGIGRPPVPGPAVADWVLGRFTPDEEALLHPVLKLIPAVLAEIWDRGPESAMNRYNSAQPV